MIKPLLTLLFCGSTMLSLAQTVRPHAPMAYGTVPTREIQDTGRPGRWTQVGIIDRTYNAAGQLASISSPVADYVRPVLYRYDALGHLVATHTGTSYATATDSSLVDYRYGLGNRIEQISAHTQQGADFYSAQYSFNYNAVGLMDTVTYFIRSSFNGSFQSTKHRTYFRYTPSRIVREFVNQIYDSTLFDQTWTSFSRVRNVIVPFNLDITDPYLIFIRDRNLLDDQTLNNFSFYIGGVQKYLGSSSNPSDSTVYTGEQQGNRATSNSTGRGSSGSTLNIYRTRDYDNQGHIRLDRYVDSDGLGQYTIETTYANTYNADSNLTEVVSAYVYTSFGRVYPTVYKRSVFSGFTVAGIAKTGMEGALPAYPNPASSHLTLPTAKPGQAYTLTDMQGRTLRSATLAADLRVETASLPAGLYQLRTAAGSVRVVKE